MARVKVISLTEHYLQSVFKSLNLTDDIAAIVEAFIRSYESGFGGFVYMLLATFSIDYYRASNPNIPFNRNSVVEAYRRFQRLHPEVSAEDLLFITKADILLGRADDDHYCSKFFPEYYESIYEFVLFYYPDRDLDDLLGIIATVTENYIKQLEFNIFSTNNDGHLDDVVVIYPVYQRGVLSITAS